MLTRSLVATAVSVAALSLFAPQPALAAGVQDFPGDGASPSATPSATDPMAGMDHDMPGMNHEDMPGMDHGSSSAAESGDATGVSGEGSGHSHAGAEPASGTQPTAALVGTFVLVNAGVMGAALVVRRRERSKVGRKRASAQQRVRNSEEQ